MLELREGVSVTVSRLRALSEISQRQGLQRCILFVDYAIVNEKIALFVVLPDSIKWFYLTLTEAQVNDWRAKHLQGEQSLAYDDDDDKSSAALQELTPLIRPLKQVSEKGDLIVLCASGPLHAIPLHAAPLDEEQLGDSLIDRNPVVYCPSITIFE